MTSLILRRCLASRFRVTVLLKSPVLHSSHSTNESRVIYEAPNKRLIVAVKCFSLLTSATGLACQPYLYSQAENLGALKFVFFGCFGTFILATPLLLHFITKSFVTKLEYNQKSNSFHATTKSIFLRDIEHKYQPEDVTPGSGMMFATATVKGKPLFIIEEAVTDIEAYKIMLGYDKPFRWESKHK